MKCERCERCGGKIVFIPFIHQIGQRKPALRGKQVCEKCGFWLLAHVTHGTPSLNKPFHIDRQADGGV